MEKQRKTLLGTAVRYLSYRPRFEAEVIERLTKKAKELDIDGPFDLIDEIIASLRSSGFVNDKELIARFISRNLKEKLRGPRWIKFRLLALGLSKPLVESSIKENIDSNTQLTVMKQLIARKTRGRIIDFKTKVKLSRFIINRGFDAYLVSEAFDEYDLADV